VKLLARSAAYLWASPYTLLGVAIGLMLGGRFQRVAGVIEIHGPLIAALLVRLYVPAMALTFGHVVFGQTEAALDITRNHERVHVRQYERWGIAFVPAYLLISAYLYLRGRDGYRENPFEIEAYAVDGE
jgi:cytochrome bd-type quinol oxidase subunit 2